MIKSVVAAYNAYPLTNENKNNNEINARRLGFQQGYEQAEKEYKNQWISVEEALPECDKCHLAMYEDGGIIVAKYENETWWWQDGFVVGRNTDGDLMYSSSCKVPSGLITHWAPIPSLEGGGE